MSASSTKKQGWMDELKKTSSKKNVFEGIEKERFVTDISGSLDKEKETDIPDIPEIDDIDMDEKLNEPPPKSTFKKELNIDILKDPINFDDKVDLTILLEALEVDDEEDEEKDEIWNWNQLFTKITAQIADEK